MKKLIFLTAIIFLLCGCSNINKISYDEILNSYLSQEKINTNTVKVGYKYYKPYSLRLVESNNYNDVFISDNHLFYMYTDLVSYFNKTKMEYVENDVSLYSKKITKDGKSGYIEINEIDDDQYLIEIMYNYAKIEVMVDKLYIDNALAISLNILFSIEYNDNVVKNLMGEDVLNSYEENINIFKTISSDKNFLEFVEEDNYDKDVIPDMDLVS